jgi:23S rRNA pseudouridine2457 synthase
LTLENSGTHYKIYKPYGFICQFINSNKRKKGLLGELADFAEGTMSVGRLDVKSEGLLILTTDGKLSHHICSSGVEKEYHVQVDGEITTEAIELLRTALKINIQGVYFITRPAKAEILTDVTYPIRNGRPVRDDRHGPTSWISLVITEGKYHQVRKMTALVGFPTLRLIRVRVGNVTLGDMSHGDVKELTAVLI